MNYDIEARRRAKMLSNDRILILRVIEGKKPLSSGGVVDSRLFTGENKLHGVFDERTGMWNMKYETGGLPGALQQKFITFEDLVSCAKTYFKTRNVEIAGIIN